MWRRAGCRPARVRLLGNGKMAGRKDPCLVEDRRLVADSAEARKLFASLASQPVLVDGDRFRAKPRRNIPEVEKPTPAMRRAQRTNIKKAQAAARKRRKAVAR